MAPSRIWAISTFDERYEGSTCSRSSSRFREQLKTCDDRWLKPRPQTGFVCDGLDRKRLRTCAISTFDERYEGSTCSRSLSRLRAKREQFRTFKNFCPTNGSSQDQNLAYFCRICRTAVMNLRNLDIGRELRGFHLGSGKKM